jgi:sugar/nucleoside kinase (ribokinase family)
LISPRFLVAGEINADLVLGGVSSFPAPGREVLVESSDLVLGSASAICAKGLARLGNGATFIGKVGDDLFGKFCTEDMRRSGIDVSRVLVDSTVSTGITVSLSSGFDRALVTCLGAIGALEAREIPDEAFEGASHLHVAAFFLQSALRPGLPDLFRRAQRHGLTTSLDPGHDPMERWEDGLEEALAEVDLFFPNEAELRAVTGISDVEAALRSLAPTEVAAKLGRNGAACLDRGSLVRVGAPKVDVVDTTGAGDSFDAGFLHAWARKEPLPTCLRYGVAAGSLSTRALGGTTAQPSLEELEALLVSTWT